MKMKKFLSLILALVMAFALVACGQKQGGSGRVFWLNFKPEADTTLQKVAAMYTEKTGVPVTVQTAASGTYNETLTSAMDKEAPPTLFVVGNQAAVGTWGDYCYDLKDTKVAGELSTDAYNLYDDSGKLCSIGYCYECYGIIVNKDLLQKAGYEQPPASEYALVYDGMLYSAARAVSGLAAGADGQVDRVILTGGIAYSRYVADYLTKKLSFIAPVEVMAGEFELEALAAGACRVLEGKEQMKVFDSYGANA